MTGHTDTVPQGTADDGRDVFVHVPGPMYVALHAAARREDRTMAALIRSALARYLSAGEAR